MNSLIEKCFYIKGYFFRFHVYFDYDKICSDLIKSLIWEIGRNFYRIFVKNIQLIAIYCYTFLIHPTVITFPKPRSNVEITDFSH